MANPTDQQLIDQEIDRNYSTPVVIRNEDKVLIAKYNIPENMADALSTWLSTEQARDIFFIALCQHDQVDPAVYANALAAQGNSIEEAVNEKIFRVVTNMRMSPALQVAPGTPIISDYDYVENLMVSFYDIPPEHREAGFIFIDPAQLPDDIKILLFAKVVMDQMKIETDFFKTVWWTGEKKNVKTSIDFYLNRDQGNKDIFHTDSSIDQVRVDAADNVDYLTLTFIAPMTNRNQFFKGTSIISAGRRGFADTEPSEVLSLGLLHGGTMVLHDSSFYHATPEHAIQTQDRHIDPDVERNRITPSLNLIYNRVSFEPLKNPAGVNQKPPKIAQSARHLPTLIQRMGPPTIGRTFLRCHHISVERSVIIGKVRVNAANVQTTITQGPEVRLGDLFGPRAGLIEADFRMWAQAAGANIHVTQVKSDRDIQQAIVYYMTGSFLSSGKKKMVISKSKAKSKAKSKRSRSAKSSKGIYKTDYKIFCNKKHFYDVSKYNTNLKIRIDLHS